MECGALGKMDIIISDASAVLRNLPWPGTGGLVSDFINTVRQHVEKLLIDYVTTKCSSSLTGTTVIL